jgi:hypothetical protein
MHEFADLHTAMYGVQDHHRCCCCSKKNSVLTQFDVDGTFKINILILLRPFQNIFKTVYSSYTSGTFSLNQCLVVLLLASISISDVQNAVTWLWPSNHLDLMVYFVLKGCFEIWVPVLQVYF